MRPESGGAALARSPSCCEWGRKESNPPVSREAVLQAAHAPYVSTSPGEMKPPPGIEPGRPRYEGGPSPWIRGDFMHHSALGGPPRDRTPLLGLGNQAGPRPQPVFGFGEASEASERAIATGPHGARSLGAPLQIWPTAIRLRFESGIQGRGCAAGSGFRISKGMRVSGNGHHRRHQRTMRSARAKSDSGFFRGPRFAAASGSLLRSSAGRKSRRCEGFRSPSRRPAAG